MRSARLWEKNVVSMRTTQEWWENLWQEGLAQRKREREAQQGWFESWFQHSPWLATLVPTLLGPLIVLILMLTFGPCILNRLASFTKECINTIQIMVLRQQYQPSSPRWWRERFLYRNNKTGGHVRLSRPAPWQAPWTKSRPEFQFLRVG